MKAFFNDFHSFTHFFFLSLPNVWLCYFSLCVRVFVYFCLYHPVDPLKASGLLENDDIVVSRRANSYVLTSVGSGGSSNVAGKKKLHNTKLRSNGLETMLKKAGAGNFNTSTSALFWNNC